MTQEELIVLCTSNLYRDFAATSAVKVADAGALDMLWDTLKNVGSLRLPKPVEDKLLFRASYILEHVYFNDRESFSHLLTDFFAFFPLATNGSMRRHFAKMGCDIIGKGYRPVNLRQVCETCADWTIDPKVKVAVKSWALETLTLLSGEQQWVTDIIPDLLATLEHDPSPGIQSTLRWLAHKGFSPSAAI